MDRADCLIVIVFLNLATIAGTFYLRDPQPLATLAGVDAAAVALWVAHRPSDRDDE